MNYTCVIVGGFLIIEVVWWFVAGQRYTRNMAKAREDAGPQSPDEVTSTSNTDDGSHYQEEPPVKS